MKYIKGNKGYWLGKKRPAFSEKWKKNIGIGHLGIKKSPHSEETKRKISLANKGRHHTEDVKKRISEKMKIINLGKNNPMYGVKQSQETIKKRVAQFRNEKHFAWKGDNAGYVAIHIWVKRCKGKPQKCVDCGTTKRKIQWSNIDHKYRRVLEDYKERCLSCHKKYDFQNHLSNIGSRGGSIKNKK